MLKFYIKNFNNLTTDELYEILKLRSKVFIVEQNCVYQDLDDKDQKALHILGYKNNRIIAYARVFNAGDYFKKASIGRIVILPKHRSKGYGFELVQTAIMVINVHFKQYDIAISAQEHLEKFYNNLAFMRIGKSYLEDGIPHIKMIRK